MTRLVLLGGGHSHIEVLRRWARVSAPAEVVLVNPFKSLPYTGMVPGFVAGLYGEDDIHIDLASLCERAQVTFARGSAVALDCEARSVRCSDGTKLRYDLLSIDVGSALDTSTPGVSEHALPVRPLYTFVSSLQRYRTAQRPQRVAVIGAGAAGVELALALHAAIARAGRTPTVTLLGDAPFPVPSFPQPARQRLERICSTRGITIRSSVHVTALSADAVHLAAGERLAVDLSVWATGPVAPAWLADSGLATDARGFIAVDRHLRSISHPDVYAAGDVAGMTGHERPKSGVYAVRQGPHLAENLLRSLRGEPLVSYIPQRRALALIGTGDRRAVAVYDDYSWEGAWVWRWKDIIDRRFVARYRAG